MIVPDNNTYSLSFKYDSVTRKLDDLCNNLTWEYVKLFDPTGYPPTIPSNSPNDLGGIDIYGSFYNKASLSNFYDKAFSIDFWWCPFSSVSVLGYAPVSTDSENSIFKPFYISSVSSNNTLARISGYVNGTSHDLAEVSASDWYHCYFGYDESNVYFAVNGIILYSGTGVSHIESLDISDLLVGVFKDSTSSYGYTGSPSAIAAFRISDICRWTADFTPPNSKSSYTHNVVIDSMLVKDSSDNIYGLTNGTFGQVATSWGNMSVADKVTTFETYAIDQITSNMLNSLSNPVNILFYDESQTQHTISINAYPSAQTILPTSLIDLSNYLHVDKITLDADVNVRIAITKDLTTYYVYRNNQFITINIADIASQGNMPTELNAISEAKWNQFTANISGIALAYYISGASTVDELRIQVDEKDQQGVLNNRFTVITKYYNDKNELVSTDTKTFDF